MTTSFRFVIEDYVVRVYKDFSLESVVQTHVSVPSVNVAVHFLTGQHLHCPKQWEPE